MSELKPCPFHNCLTCGCYDTLYMRDKDWNTRPIEDALNARIAELEAAQRWIPVGERLPEENQQILSTDGKEFYLDCYARWEGKDNPPCFYDRLFLWAVTHWMPLPQLPEVKE